MPVLTAATHRGMAGLSWPGWHVQITTWYTCETVTDHSTYWGRRTVTLLMNLTLLPLKQTATNVNISRSSSAEWKVSTETRWHWNKSAWWLRSLHQILYCHSEFHLRTQSVNKEMKSRSKWSWLVGARHGIGPHNTLCINYLPASCRQLPNPGYWSSKGFTFHLTQNRSYWRRSPSQSLLCLGLVWKNKT